jgi:hypothetical protein
MHSNGLVTRTTAMKFRKTSRLGLERVTAPVVSKICFAWDYGAEQA